MKILALDTSTMTTTTALLEGEKVLANYSLQGQAMHSEAVLDLIDDFLTHLGLALKDMDLIAVGIGPGSFTGLRIATTAAKVMAQVLDKPVIGVSSLESLAESIYTPGLVIPMIDANRGRVYTASFMREESGELKRLTEDELVDLDDLLEKYGDREALFISPQWEKIDEMTDTKITWFIGDQDLSAISLARVGKRHFVNGREDNLYELAPNYMREAQVIRKKKKRKRP